MPKIQYECSDWNCDGTSTDLGAPRPTQCLCGAPLAPGLGYRLDTDDDDASFPSPTQNNSPRPAWKPGRRAQLKERNRSPGGTLYCSLCGLEIVVNRRGKEEWTSKSGKPHETSPHVDHYGSTVLPRTVTGGVGGVKGDWNERKYALRNSTIHMAKPEAERKRIEREVYNASPLRTTHMTCNCSRPKTRPGPY